MENPENTEPKPLDKELVKKIILALKAEHKRRYGEKIVVSGPDNKYVSVPKVMSYKLVFVR